MTQRVDAGNAVSVEPTPVAPVDGAHIEVPDSLYIPPEAMEVVLETFEGPLDLLLYLIRKHEFDILNVRIAEITEQYMQYIELMTALKLELAGEYLLMAATLAEIKSRMLLPVADTSEEDDEDQRTRLLQQLLEYSKYKSAAEHIDSLPRAERDVDPVRVETAPGQIEVREPEVDLRELVLAMAAILRQSELLEAHQIAREPLSVRERMTKILSAVTTSSDPVAFESLIDHEEGKPGVVVVFLALMDLVRERVVELIQPTTFGPISVRSLLAVVESP